MKRALSAALFAAFLSAPAAATTTPPPAPVCTPEMDERDDPICEAQDRAEAAAERSILAAADRFFGDASSEIADQIDDIIDAYGEPTGYIAGEELSAAFFGGVRFGRGELVVKNAAGEDEKKKLFWQGPSAGYDFGGNASKVFFLVYNLPEREAIYARFPAVEGGAYLGAGLTLAYKRGDGVTLIPVRTGIGLRAGANIGYLHFTREASWLPL